MTSAKVGHQLESLSPRQGQFTFALISRRLARLPGRLEVDEDEAYRILFHFIGLYERGHFGVEEVVALYGDPPRFRPLKSLPKKAQQLSPIDWRDGAVSLTATALNRYLQGSTLDGAARLLRELFGDHLMESDSGRPGMPAGQGADTSNGKEGVARKRPIPDGRLTEYLRAIKEQGGNAPAADGLYTKVKAAFPDFYVTREDVRTVHKKVFGILPPGKRSNRAFN